MTTMSDALNRFWYVPTSNTNLCKMHTMRFNIRHCLIRFKFFNLAKYSHDSDIFE